MTKVNIFKIELQKAIADVSENTLMPTAKELLEIYEIGFSKMKTHQMESLANIAMSISELSLPGKNVVPFINNQAAKNLKEKSDKLSWAFKPEGINDELSKRLLQVIFKQKEQTEQILELLTNDFADILSDSKNKKKWTNYTQCQLVKDFIIHLVSWYNALKVLKNLEEVGS